MTGAIMGHEPDIWMNVTTSANWTRAVVGIVRVERELCKELALLYGKRFGQCIFQNDEFVSLSAVSKAVATPQGVIWPDTSRRFPKSSSFDPAFGKGSFTRSGDKAKSGLGALEKMTRRQDLTDGPTEIKYGDILISVGLDWGQPYVEKFQELKDLKGVRIVTCCYDLIPVLFPQYCVGHVAAMFKEYFGKLSWSSSLMLCISNQSRNDYRDLVNRLGAPEIDSVVIPLGDNLPDNEGELSAEIQRLIGTPFILFVSTIERRKNHEVLYRAYHLLARAGHADKLPKLVFVGMPGWGVGDFLQDIELDPETRGLIVQLNHVDDAELHALYSNATFMVYPSLYEGWGLPVGEALAYGKAIMASAQGSIPEVGGELVTYLDPWNPQAWAVEILDWVENPDKVRAIENNVSENYVPRTWAGTAQVVKGAIDAMGPLTKESIVIYPGYDMRTFVGIPCGDTIRSSGFPGILLFGPYLALPEGNYDLVIRLDKIGNSSGFLMINTALDRGAVKHEAVPVKFGEAEQFDRIITLKVEFSEPVKDFEVVFEVSEGLLVSVNKIEIRPSGAAMPLHERQTADLVGTTTNGVKS